MFPNAISLSQGESTAATTAPSKPVIQTHLLKTLLTIASRVLLPVLCAADTSLTALVDSPKLVSAATKPVVDVILQKIMPTLIMVGIAEIIAIFVGMTLGVISAWKRGTKIDVFALGFSLIIILCQ